MATSAAQAIIRKETEDFVQNLVRDPNREPDWKSLESDLMTRVWWTLRVNNIRFTATGLDAWQIAMLMNATMDIRTLPRKPGEKEPALAIFQSDTYYEVHDDKLRRIALKINCRLRQYDLNSVLRHLRELCPRFAPENATC